ncbi:MAG: 5-dehydro-2-deoxygluconokinase [Nocardioides sp.]
MPLKDVRTFARSLGGTATNVAVAAARLGHRSAVLTKVGADGFGEFVREELARLAVDTAFVGAAPDLQTPVVFCALDPPEDPPLTFYRSPIAPDHTLTSADVPWNAISSATVLWVTGTGVSVEPARSTQLEILQRRNRPQPGSGRWTILDLDWRERFWSSVGEARAYFARMLDCVTVAIGNCDEVEVAVGTRDAHEAADRLLGKGVEIAVVKLGAQGVLVATAHQRQVVAPHQVEVVCGLGSGDAFGGAFVHGLLSGWDPVRCAAYGNAAGVLVASRLACAEAMPTKAEVDSLIAAREAPPPDRHCPGEGYSSC